MNSDPKAKDEYNSAAENIRHYENLLFANLAAFLTINGGLIGIIFAARSAPSAVMLSWISRAGIVFACAFGFNGFIYLWRCYRLLKLENDLEDSQLHYAQYHRISPWYFRWWPGILLWGMIYLSMFIFWYRASLANAVTGPDSPKAPAMSSGNSVLDNNGKTPNTALEPTPTAP
jgi:hypothetical protein